MNNQQVDALVQIGAMAVETLLDFLQRAPADDDERQAQDRAALALVDQAQRLGDAVRARLGVPDQESAARSREPGGLADPPAVYQSAKEADREEARGAASRAASAADPARSTPSGSEGLRADLDNACDPARALAATLWGEARGEPLGGKVAVACVVRNRAANPGWWGRDVVSVCTAPAQFTCWHDRQSARVRCVDETAPGFVQCLAIARGVIAGKYHDPTGGADHYHVADMDPPPAWACGKTPTAHIGAHLFYRLGLDGRG